MAYINRPNVTESTTAQPTIERNRIRWGPILAGLFIAIALQLVLSGIGEAVGFSTIAGSGVPRTTANEAVTPIGIWTIVSLFISLLIGSWMMGRSYGPMNRNTALLNGAVLWAVTLVVSAWMLAIGVAGAFGVLASNLGNIATQVQQGSLQPSGQLPNAQQTRAIAGNTAMVGWSFAFGSLLGLVAALIGAAFGSRDLRSAYREPDYQDRPDRP